MAAKQQRLDPAGSLGGGTSSTSGGAAGTPDAAAKKGRDSGKKGAATPSRTQQERAAKQRSIDSKSGAARVIAQAGVAGGSRAPKGKSGNPAARRLQEVRPARFGDWVGGARIRTLPMAVAPVLIGTGAAIFAGGPGEYHWVRALLCLVTAVSLQIAVNYANDYSDGVRGTDAVRVGPSRLVGSGRASARSVLIVAFAFFGIAAVAGIVLTVLTQYWWLLIVGAACIAAAWFYTGGKRPYGYYALGEVFVFLFFGLVATLGTMFVQVGTLSQEAWFGAAGAGLIACSAILVNNLRDRDQDRLVGKRTLSVLIGSTASRVLFVVLLLAPFLLASWVAFLYPELWFSLFALLAALPACVIVVTAQQPRELIIALRLVGITQLLYGLAWFWALAF
ncbi:1,4-dihydroxy-2-naphthoate prenyltransferase [Labedella gwakjiensis]|uniref:1,4-dihydroxy-2-naphthoate octaprenyltransferase n=1 Tax=Labedella gwakjiensis TaxID=390269 RepID=A0A2P8GSW5_9MICO|nr:1,4-dihydroxy-2-naphthoate polyprenyltransferase [Labedella gwakjiensis]PSL37059.1 1,4-dihydroxy-2-naphthoate prenyltransferase [Labedella gwakjiensis]